MKRKGICCAGNMIVDITYPIETWPKQNELTHITEGITRSTGGSVCNTISDLARLDPQLPLVASGFAGHDAEGDFVLREMGKIQEYRPFHGPAQRRYVVHSRHVE